jgi:hypothetical protein
MGFNTEINNKPLQFLKKTDRVFQKEIQSFLEHTQLPLYTFQFVKQTSEDFLKQKACFWWDHPTHFRSNWLILNDNWQAVFINPKEPANTNTARIPLLRANVKQQGPFVLEVMVDTVERIVWVVDVLHAKGEDCFNTMTFIERFEIVQKVLKNCIQSHAVLQSCEVKLAPWKQLTAFSNYSPNEKCCVSFVSNEPGQRRHVWKNTVEKLNVVNHRIPDNTSVKHSGAKHSSTKQPSQYGFIDDVKEEPVLKKEVVVQASGPAPNPEPLPIELSEDKFPVLVNKKYTKAIAYKDPKATGPDLYLLEHIDGSQLGTLALRSMQLRILLRKAVDSRSKVPVSIAWYEPFQKYEIKSIID